MNRPQQHAESVYFIQQRYEDTALLIFQQQAKRRKELKKNSGQHQHQAVPYHVQLAPPGHRSPGRGRGPGNPAPLGSEPVSGNSGSFPPPSPSSGTRPQPVPPANAGRGSSLSSSHHDGWTSGAAAGAGIQDPPEVPLSTAAKPDSVTPRQSDIILSHPLSGLEPDPLCGSAVGSPLQSSTHSDLTATTSDNTASLNSAVDGSLPSDTESDTAVRPEDPESDDDDEKTHVSESELKADLGVLPAASELKAKDSAPEVKHARPEVTVKPILPTENLKPSLPEDVKWEHSVAEEKEKGALAQNEEEPPLAEELVKQIPAAEDTAKTCEQTPSVDGGMPTAADGVVKQSTAEDLVKHCPGAEDEVKHSSGGEDLVKHSSGGEDEVKHSSGEDPVKQHLSAEVLVKHSSGEDLVKQHSSGEELVKHSSGEDLVKHSSGKHGVNDGELASDVKTILPQTTKSQVNNRPLSQEGVPATHSDVTHVVDHTVDVAIDVTTQEVNHMADVTTQDVKHATDVTQHHVKHTASDKDSNLHSDTDARDTASEDGFKPRRQASGGSTRGERSPDGSRVH
ncbi:uncharacterized protein LOC143276226 isoform X2 [Babylonia areolata]|uniref:uncharacterized protein LOC143276226 isoform X2 n=1 Tax=Babylonia areolata TaxID=304850 RepID=UPI003FD01FD1